MIVGIDAGNYRVKVCGPQGLDTRSYLQKKKSSNLTT